MEEPNGDDAVYIDIAEFQREGFLQEANRQFFHPHGLALAVSTGWESWEDVQKWLAARGVKFGMNACQAIFTFLRKADLDGVHLHGVWDYRDDAEGIVYSDLSDQDSVERASRVAVEWDRHADARTALFGAESGGIQPIGDVCSE